MLPLASVAVATIRVLVSTAGAGIVICFSSWALPTVYVSDARNVRPS